MDPPAQFDATPEPPVVFRGKKRKLYRQRATEDANTQEQSTNQESAATDGPEAPRAESSKPQTPAENEDDLSVAEIIRRRNARKSRLRGVGFGVDGATQGDGSNLEDELSLMIREEEQKALDAPVGGMTNRFTAQTGMAGELVNKHM
jgi:hypothetical protein